MKKRAASIKPNILIRYKKNNSYSKQRRLYKPCVSVDAWTVRLSPPCVKTGQNTPTCEKTEKYKLI